MDYQPADWQHCLEYAALSDIGLRRSNNQDSKKEILASSEAVWQQRGHLFIVADGMGAHAAGELASKIATDTVPQTYAKLTDRSPPEAILEAVRDSNTQIHNRGQASPDFRGMGTTCTVLVLLPQGAVLAHVGDSRGYRLRGNRLEQLTFDHSLVWEMRASGQIQDQVPEYIPKNVITRSLGPNPTVQVDLEGPFPIAVGDTFLLCSDGLSGPVKDDEIGAIVRCLPPGEAARALVDLANLRGGPDNVTVIVVRVTGPELAATASPVSNNNAKYPTSTRPVHPALWISAGVPMLAGILLLATGMFVPGLACLLGAAVPAAVALMKRYGGKQTRLPMTSQSLGRGPHTATDCKPSPGMSARLAEILRQLREVATREKWNVDWDRFNGHVDGAARAGQTGDQAEAIAQYCRAMSFIMEELRNQRKSGDSSVRL